MKWLPDVRRSQDASGAIVFTIASSVIIALIVSLFRTQAFPALSDVLFGILPQTIFAIIGTSVMLSVIGRERIELALAHAAGIVGVSLGLSAAVSILFGVRGDTVSSTLLPSEAVQRILTGGYFPIDAQSDNFARFLPVFLVIGLGLVLWRRANFTRVLIALLSWYLSFSILLYGMSWIAGAMSKSSNPLSSAEVHRVLVSAQRDGYWTMQQQDRFFAPIGRQTNTSFMATESALFLLASFGLLVWTFWKRVSGSDALIRRLATRSVGAFMLAAVAGLMIGTAGRALNPSYTDVLAEFVYLFALISWLLWWRLRRDLENLPTDLTTRPRLPLPSGVVTPQAVQELIQITGAMSFVSVATLGWPVVLPFICAALVTWVSSRQGLAWGSGAIGGSVSAALTSGLLALSALEVGLRHLSASSSHLRFLMMIALLVGLGELFSHMREEMESRIPVAMAFLVFGVFAVLASRQPSLVYLLVPYVIGLGWAASKPSNWHKFGAYPLYGLLAGIVCIELFLPHLIVLTA